MLPILKDRNISSLRRHDPWNAIDRFFEDLWRGPTDGLVLANVGNIDVHEDDTHLYVDVELPGFQRNQIDLTLEDGVLHLQAERSEEEKQDKDNYYIRERSYGKWARSIRLPVPVQEDKVNASFKDGVLKVALEKREQKKAHKIEVK